MATFKRGKVFWTDFTHDGTRYRESLKTTNWQEALKKERNRIEEVRRGENLASERNLAKGFFEQAAERYLESRKLDLAPRSLAKERESLAAPRRAFGSLPLTKIKPDTVRDYLIRRKEGGLSNATLNMERGAIIRVMRLHDLRHSSITMLAEGNASEQTIRSIAGHLSWRMLEHYSHIRKEAKRRALAAICLPKSNAVPVLERAKMRESALSMAQTASQKLLGAGEGSPN